MIKYLLLPIFSYLLGSIPIGLILTRLFTPINIRQVGSGNIGATNVGRMAGPGLGVLTLTGDILKGAFPVWLAASMTTPNGIWGALYIASVAFAAFMGHLYPVYLKFKNGGKGVAVVVLILVFIMFVCWSNRVSMASLAAAAVLPVAIWKATGSGVLLGCAIITTIFIYFRHADNIKRLLKGTEPLIWK